MSSPCQRCWPRNPDGSLKGRDDGTAGTIEVDDPAPPPELVDLLATLDRIRELPPLPDAHVRDRSQLVALAALTASAGRWPWPRDPARQFGGIPIYLDPDVPPGIVELRHPDGRVDRLTLPVIAPPPAPTLDEILRLWSSPEDATP